MTYGEHLEDPAAALAQAYAALRGQPPDPAARASAAVSRAGLYRSLAQQVVAFGRVHASELPPIGEVPPSYQWRPVPRNPVTTWPSACGKPPPPPPSRPPGPAVSASRSPDRSPPRCAMSHRPCRWPGTS
jgi:hypothetical protein